MINEIKDKGITKEDLKKFNALQNKYGDNIKDKGVFTGSNVEKIEDLNDLQKTLIINLKIDNIKKGGDGEDWDQPFYQQL